MFMNFRASGDVKDLQKPLFLDSGATEDKETAFAHGQRFMTNSLCVEALTRLPSNLQTQPSPRGKDSRHGADDRITEL